MKLVAAESIKYEAGAAELTEYAGATAIATYSAVSDRVTDRCQVQFAVPVEMPGHQRSLHVIAAGRALTKPAPDWMSEPRDQEWLLIEWPKQKPMWYIPYLIGIRAQG
jgi:hypothetical protein